MPNLLKIRLLLCLNCYAPNLAGLQSWIARSLHFELQKDWDISVELLLGLLAHSGSFRFSCLIVYILLCEIPRDLLVRNQLIATHFRPPFGTKEAFDNERNIVSYMFCLQRCCHSRYWRKLTKRPVPSHLSRVLLDS